VREDVDTIVFPLPTDELLDEVERGLRISFPETYRDFIKGRIVKPSATVPLKRIRKQFASSDIYAVCD